MLVSSAKLEEKKENQNQTRKIVNGAKIIFGMTTVMFVRVWHI